MRGSIPTGRDLRSSGNKLKLGLFGFNCSNALSLTLADTTYKATWDHTLASPGILSSALVFRWIGSTI
jgi:hypothetical protein